MGDAYQEPGRAAKNTCPVGNTAAALSSSKRKSGRQKRLVPRVRHRPELRMGIGLVKLVWLG